MTIPMDSLGALNVFVQAAEARSFTIAGRQLGVSSSAVGKAVARLEARLGVRLFHRSTRAITLTPEGAMFLERCRRIFCEMEAAELELSQTRAHPSGVLRVSLPLVGMLMMPTLSAFMRAWPDVELDLDFTDRLVDVIEEGFAIYLFLEKMGIKETRSGVPLSYKLHDKDNILTSPLDSINSFRDFFCFYLFFLCHKLFKFCGNHQPQLYGWFHLKELLQEQKLPLLMPLNLPVLKSEHLFFHMLVLTIVTLKPLSEDSYKL